MDESGTEKARCRRKVSSGRRVSGDIKSLVSGRSCGFSVVWSCMSLVLVLTYSSATMIWKEKEKSRVRAVQMNDLRGLLGIGKMDKVSNARIRELCGVTKCVREKIDECVLRWIGLVERIQND